MPIVPWNCKMQDLELTPNGTHTLKAVNCGKRATSLHDSSLIKLNMSWIGTLCCSAGTQDSEYYRIFLSWAAAVWWAACKFQPINIWIIQPHIQYVPIILGMLYCGARCISWVVPLLTVAWKVCIVAVNIHRDGFFFLNFILTYVIYFGNLGLICIQCSRHSYVWICTVW